MAYQVLARGWRPQQFQDVVGQDAVVTTLKNALSSDTLGHAYLFSGLRGVGKTTAARLLAKAVNCDKGPTPDPCGECVPCTEVALGSSMDVVELDGASNRGIDDVRELREMLRYRPTRDRFRVIIIDEVHMLTREAFNALLKSLEEPPPYILFILATTERQKLPSTILSRCQQLEFRAVSSELITQRLVQIAEGEGFSLTREAAGAVARAAQGSVRDALSLIDQLRAFAADEVDEDAVAEILGVPPFERVVRLVDALAGGSAAAGLANLREELVSGHDPVVLYHEVGRVLRLAMYLGLDPSLEIGVTDDHKKLLIGVAKAIGADPLTRMLGLWLEHEGLVRDASNRELALEVACLRLARWPAVQRVEAFLAGGPAPVGPGGGGSGRRSDSEPSSARSAAPAAASAAPVSEAPVSEKPERQAAPLDPVQALVAHLWAEHDQELAGAVDSADGTIEDGLLVLRFPAGARILAEMIESKTGRQRLQAVWTELGLKLTGLRVEVAGDRHSLLEEVAADPEVVLVKDIIGGDLVAAWPDNGSVS